MKNNKEILCGSLFVLIIYITQFILKANEVRNFAIILGGATLVIIFIKSNQYVKGFKDRIKKRKIKYMDLAPSDNIDEGWVYIDALNWAIRNDKITNIALTGNYGSGKSSVIKTFIKRMWHNKDSNWLRNILMNLYYYLKFKSLCISLATFVDGNPSSENEDHEGGENLQNGVSNDNSKKQITPKLQEIEKSILQQMFYSVKGKRISSSRFRRINHISNKKISSSMFLVSMLISIGIFILNPEFVDKFQKKFTELKSVILNTFFNGMNQWEEFSEVLVLACYLLFFIGCLVIIFFIIKYFSNSVKLGKINMSNFEFEFDNQKDNSIFNKYLDEIIYFFQVCRHNLVFIEDLDRFDSVAIFTKLRELNTLINNSEQIRRKVVFIYAIKDDMFLESKERTKFFDFIVPVIPAINASNSNVILMKKLKEMNLSNELSEEFIDEIAIFIDDMRILKSIVNEFYIYREKLKNSNKNKNGEVIPLKNIKMMSIIVYKNLFPKDFSLLQLGVGLVNEAFMDKNKFLIQLIKDVDDNIKEVENRLICTKSELLNNQEELSLAFTNYVKKYMSQVHTNQYNSNFFIGNISCSINQPIWNGIDYSTLSNDTEIKVYNNAHKLFSLKELIEYFKLPYSFQQRYDAIKLKDKNSRKELQNRLMALKIERDEISSYTLSLLIEKYGQEKVLSENIYKNGFIAFLLRNSYIDEQHQMYVSYFHEGSLTVSDAGFVLNVKYRKCMEPTYKLNNKEKIIKKLNLLDFKSKVVLNYDLFNYLLGNVEKSQSKDNEDAAEIEKMYTRYYNSSLEQLVNNIENQMNFIDAFKRITEYKLSFIKSLCHEWSNIWDYIEALSLFSEEKKTEYLKDIVLYADTEDLLKVNASKGIASFIENDLEFLKIFAFEDAIVISKVKEVIDKLLLKFKVLDAEFKEHILFEYICENNFYAISQEMLKLILHNKLGCDKADIDTKNYSVIMNSGYDSLKAYIKSNLEQYVKDIIIGNDNNRNESEDSILDLLNQDTKILSLETKIKVIKHCNTLITSLNKVDNELWNTFISERKVVSSWNNVLIYYAYIGSIDDDLCKYLNTQSNYLSLSQTKLNSLEDVEIDIKDNLVLGIIHCKSIADEALLYLANSIEIKSAILDFENLSESKTRILIENNQILFNGVNYKGIREDHKSLLIIFLEKYVKEFLDEVTPKNTDKDTSNSFVLDNYDVIAFLNSRIIIDGQKIQLIKYVDMDLMCNDKDIADLLVKYVLVGEAFEISKVLLKSLLGHISEHNNKISLLINQMDNLDERQIYECLDVIGGQFAKVGKPNEKLRFDDTSINTEIFDILKQKLENSIKVIKKSEIIYVNSKSDEN
jgi:hypothetical protein